jgi:hypothetical protein
MSLLIHFTVLDFASPRHCKNSPREAVGDLRDKALITNQTVYTTSVKTLLKQVPKVRTAISLASPSRGMSPISMT